MKQALLDLLDKHNVREPVADAVLWRNPVKSGLALVGGLATFVLVHVLGIGMLTVVGTLAIFQLFTYRLAEALQTKGLIPERFDLREMIVVTPDASTISASIDVVGDLLRSMEEAIKEISLTADYLKLATGVGSLVVLAAVGRVVPLPVLLVTLYVGAFTFPLVYTKNQDKVDQIVGNALEATEIFLEKNLQTKVKLT